MKKSTLLHLRFPFSFFLLPVFLFGCSVTSEINLVNFLLVFFILHFLIYPASNGFNSYFDKDEDSIGGLKNPPPVSKELYWVSLALDGLGMALGLLISLEFVAMIFIYGIVSKAYSHPSIRLKKFPITGWLAAGIFQGYFTFLLTYVAVSDSTVSSVNWPMHFAGILSSLLLLGSYPMTQVYQHEEDLRRGDSTISTRLGILGTFVFTAIFFTIAMAGFGYYYFQYSGIESSITFFAFLSPVLAYFLYWFSRVRKDTKHADFSSTMRLNQISSLMLNLFFLYYWLF